jgi:hypothetical protein
MNSNSCNSSSGHRKLKTFSNTTTRIARTTACLVGIAERMTITARAFSPAQPLRVLTMLNGSYSSLRMECVYLTSDADQAPRPIILPAGAASKSCA